MKPITSITPQFFRSSMKEHFNFFNLVSTGILSNETSKKGRIVCICWLLGVGMVYSPPMLMLPIIRIRKHTSQKRKREHWIAEVGFDPTTYGLWAHRANHCATLLVEIFICMFQEWACAQTVCTKTVCTKKVEYPHVNHPMMRRESVQRRYWFHSLHSCALVMSLCIAWLFVPQSNHEFFIKWPVVEHFARPIPQPQKCR